MNPEIKTIAVIGAGTMGRGIAYAAAFGGYATVLEDISAANAGRKRALDCPSVRGRSGSRQSRRQRFATARIPLITPLTTVQDAIRDADLIIEAVPEEMEMKMELFTIFDKFAKPGAIFASNTSSLSISDMSDLTVSRERCIGMHFFNPVPKMKLIELVKNPSHLRQKPLMFALKLASAWAKKWCWCRNLPVSSPRASTR